MFNKSLSFLKTSIILALASIFVVYIVGFLTMNILMLSEGKLKSWDHILFFVSEEYMLFVVIALAYASPAIFLYFLCYIFYLKPKKADLNLELFFAFFISFPSAIFYGEKLFPILFPCFLIAGPLVALVNRTLNNLWSQKDEES